MRKRKKGRVGFKNYSIRQTKDNSTEVQAWFSIIPSKKMVYKL